MTNEASTHDSRPDDNEMIVISYSSSSNITFHGEIETEITRAEWREMSSEEQDELVKEYTCDLVDITVKGGK